MKILLMYKPDKRHFEDLKKAAPSAQFAIVSNEEDAKTEIIDTEIVLGNRYFIQSLPFAKKLKWMQSNSVGVDLILSSELMKENQVILTNARGIYDNDLADHAMALFLTIARGLHIARDRQKNSFWEREHVESIYGKKAMILGMGGAGRAIAKRLKVYGVKIYGVCKTMGRKKELKNIVEKTLGHSEWRRYLSDMNYIFVALPLTKDTYHLIGTNELESLNPQAIIVNISRGKIIDEKALQEAFAANKIKGAGLDVFEEEPLPSEHWIWSESRIVVSPHLGRSKEEPPFRWEGLFVKNLKRYIKGKALINVVDKHGGY